MAFADIKGVVLVDCRGIFAPSEEVVKAMVRREVKASLGDDAVIREIYVRTYPPLSSAFGGAVYEASAIVTFQTIDRKPKSMSGLK